MNNDDYLTLKCQRTVLILGNGFDLDLGLKTSYKDFFHSDEWPFVTSSGEIPLGRFLATKGSKEQWYDLEKLLEEYGKVGDYTLKQINEEAYDKLKTALCKYLCRVQSEALIGVDHIEKDSYAARLIGSIHGLDEYLHIITFNYTDIHKECDSLGIDSTHLLVNHMHGSLSNNDIILGVGDANTLAEGYSFLYKAFDKSYSPPMIERILQDATDVIFFGLSMGDVDYPYFDEFFKSLMKLSSGTPKHVTVFVWSEEDRMNVLNNIRTMNGGHIIGIHANNKFEIITTEGDRDHEKFDSFLHYVGELKSKYETEQLLCNM